MHRDQFCQKFLAKSLPKSLHIKRAKCLTNIIESMLGYGKQISVNEIGRHLQRDTDLKHKLKAADRFVGNNKINADIPSICASMANFIYSSFKELCVLVDWSGCCQKGMFVLQASVAVTGRSLPIYAEVHELKDTENTIVHDNFLEKLSKIIPKHIKTTIVTDAGFHRDWFKKVSQLGWDYIGRVYSKYQYRLENTKIWQKVSDISFSRVNQAEKIGKIELGKTKNQLSCNLYTYKHKLSGKPHKKNKYPDHEKAFSKYYRSGWVIVSSIDKPARYLISYYKKRMQIEQNFRDIKNQELGLGLRRNKSKGKNRAEVLYFVAMMLTIILWWIGYCGEMAGQQRKYQANTVKSHRVISFMTLGKLILAHGCKIAIWPAFLIARKTLSDNYVGLMNYDPAYT